MRLAVELMLVGLALLAAVVPLPPTLVETWFSTGAYPYIQRALTPVTNLLPFAALDILIVLALGALLTGLWRGARRSWRERRARPVLATFGHVAVAAAAMYLLFLGLWGFNYRRLPMTERLTLADAQPDRDAVVALATRAAAEMNRLHGPAHQRGWIEEPWRDGALRGAFTRVQRLLADAPDARPGRWKATLLGAYFRWTGVDGMVNPFGLEVLANPDLLPFEQPFVAAHEWAHLAGYADEAEASFVGWLTCMFADVPGQYSGWMFLYWQVSGELSRSERERVAATLDAGPRRDLEAVVRRLQQGRWPLLQAAGWAVYDQYLKANRVDAGIRSYGLVVTLVLRARFDEGWTPVRRAPASSR